MPRPTFDNLAADKRERLLRAAEAEFARHDYADANLDRIARAARVPKGSLYQYFAGKEDFYLHVVRGALDRAWQFFERQVAQKQPADCFAYLAEAMVHMEKLRRDEPDLAALYARVVLARDVHARRQLFPVYVAYSDRFYARLIPWGVADGLLDPDLPPAVIRFHINAVGSHFQFLVLTGDAPPWFPTGERPLRDFACDLIETLRRALAPRRAPQPGKE